MTKLLLTVIVVSLAVISFMVGHYVSEASVEKSISGAPISKNLADILESRTPTITYPDSSLAGIDDKAIGLKQALLNYETRPCMQYTEGTYKINFLAISPDSKQALVGLGCGSQGYVRAIFIKQSDGWRKIGAPHFTYRNQDDQAIFSHAIDVPSCEIVGQYSIDQSIAPFCYTGTPDLPDYKLRST